MYTKNAATNNPERVEMYLQAAITAKIIAIVPTLVFAIFTMACGFVNIRNATISMNRIST
jgi:hypothetical protein